MPTREEVAELLSVLDKNKDKKISVDELKTFLDSSNCKLDRNKIQTFINVHDKDKDGMLNLDELIDVLSE
ncbi:putative calcium-binding protein [Fasciola gigantica]|uniref:Putative calcium-binding protein n=1 Tax=Fasciola gigantica TaxID=46835 RepID=A0A504YFY5_FASGI|nr:putative calcium-binding protein [Fasciola gigantica]